MGLLCVDLGGTFIKGGLFDGDNLVSDCRAATRATSREQILKSLFEVIDSLFNVDVSAIGVASAGNINNITGECVYATDNLAGWTGVNIIKEIQERYGVFALAENDAIAGLFGEYSYYKDRSSDVTMLTLGTGVGGASIVGGEVLRGENFDGGRWGHFCIEDGGKPCNCGKFGCSEQYLSATALMREVKTNKLEADNCKSLFELFRNGDKTATEILGRFGEMLERLLVMINGRLAPDYIIIGGGVANSRDIITKLLGGRVKNIAFARLGERSALYGMKDLLKDI